MEIHVPSGRAHSLKNFAIELGTITAGILIALTLEALVERHHYRVLADEARETILSEMRDNEAELQRVLKNTAESSKNIESSLASVEGLIARRKLDVKEFSLGVAIAELSSSSWQTAEHTGALGHMPYAEVQKYSKVYSFQELYLSRQRQSLERLASALSLVRYGGDPNQASTADLRALRGQILDLQAALYLEEQFGKGLLEAYQKFLEKER